jgi:hypothetical protein
MSKGEAVLIVSRAVAFYLFIWALDNLTYLPGRLMLVQRWTTNIWHSYDMLGAEFTVFRFVALLGAAFLFYECGPRVQAFLLPPEEPIETR